VTTTIEGASESDLSLSNSRAAREAADCDVAVVGLGPVGTVTAQLLARAGLRVVGIEQDLVPFDRPRAIGIDHESLRILQRICDADALGRILGPHRLTEYKSKHGEVLRRLVPQPEPFPLGWPPSNTFVQPELEQLLRNGFANWKNLEVLLGWRCDALEKPETIPTLTIRKPGSDIERVVRSRYVIACDGARSPIREALGLKLEDLEFDEPWLVIDVLVDDAASLPEVTTQFCDPDRPCTFIAGPRNLRRWEIMLLPGEQPDDMIAEAVIWRLLARWLRPGQGKIWRAATYRFHALVCCSWRHGNVFVAGDAAHQTPPFMAQGLNQGIRDVANLSWKLALCVKSGARETLLDSYDQERRPNARAVIDFTKTLGKLICERDPVAAAERNRRLLDEMETGKGVLVRQNLLPPLRGGFLQVDANGEHPPGVGTVFPQPWVLFNEVRCRMDDVVDGFRLFLSRECTPTEADVGRGKDLGVAVVRTGHGSAIPGAIAIEEEAGMISGWLQRHEASAVLVRPDHVVFALAQGSEAASMLLQLFEGRLRDG
jgi:3-(3-hydroxy-phenyl)propionate hydroxylase